MKNSYPYEKFITAMNGMVASSESIQNRIASAYATQLHLIKSEDLPEEVRYRFTQLSEKITSIKPTGNEGSIFATMNKMDTNSAIEMATELFSIFLTVVSDYHKSLRS